LTVAVAAAPARTRSHSLDRWLLVLILVAALLIRVLAASRSRLWFDEIYTLWVARRPLPDLLRTVASDIHPPLHYLMVWGWRAIGGESDVWIKSLSIVIGLATVWLVYAIGRDLFARDTGLIAAAVLALHPAHVAFSQESRSYALLFFLLALAEGCAWRWVVTRSTHRAVGFVLAGTAALYTHYLAAPVLACVGLWGLVVLRRERRAAMIWLGLHAAIALLFLPQLHTVLTQLARLRADRWVKPASLVGLLNLFRLLSFSRTLVIVPLITLAILPLFDRGGRRAAALMWLGSLVPALALWGAAMLGAGVFVERYMLFALPAWCVLLAAGVTGPRSMWVRVPALALLLLVAARALMVQQPQPESEAMVRIEDFLAPRVRPGDVVVHADAHSLLFARHYALDRGEHLLYLPRPRLPYYEGDAVIPAEWRIGPKQLERLQRSGRTWWGVTSRYGYAPADSGARDLAAAARGPTWVLGRATVWKESGTDTTR
jgi:mannosyltransferase